MRSAYVILVLGALIMAGCLGSVGGGQFATSYLDELNRTAVSSPQDIELCAESSCWGMVCRNGTNLFGDLPNLIGGYCYFETNLTQDRWASLASNAQTPALSIRQFMIGQGPTFYDFSQANPYCSHRLNMAVQWLVATNETDYPRPDPSRAMCFLSKDIMPVYVLYSEGDNIDIERSREIGNILGTQGTEIFQGRLSSGPVGPVVVVTEINYDDADSTQVANQIRAINDACNNDRNNNRIYCFVAVAPKINDFQALDAVMRDVGDEVDLVAFGVDGRYVHGCDGSNIQIQARNFSSYALYRYGKPSIIPYVLFDSTGTDADQSCNWTESRMIAAYSAFWPQGILSLKERGVIGVAPYSFNSTTYNVANPLDCVDCGIGKTQARLASWYSWCQRYSNTTRPTSTSGHVPGANLIVFPNQSSGYCDFSHDQAYVLREISFGDAASTRDLMNPQQPTLRTPTDLYFSCDACVISNATRPKPFAFQTSSLPAHACTIAMPELDNWASLRNIDPMLARAFMWTESGGNPCAAVKVCSAEYKQRHGTAGCFQNRTDIDDECYEYGYVNMEDPSGNCSAYLTPAANWQSARPDYKFCALGSMQVVEPPYTLWPASDHPDGEDGALYASVYQKGHPPSVNLDIARSCAPPEGYFNPFNATHAACLGTLKMEDALRRARIEVERLHSAGYLNWPTTDFDKDNVFAAYIAGNMYAGFWGATTNSPHCPAGSLISDCWPRAFQQSWTVNATYCSPSNRDDLDTDLCSSYGVPKRNPPLVCYGYTDFVQYVRECEVPYLRRQADPGANKMSVYYWLVDQSNCENSYCPEGARLIRAMDRSIPASGTPYIPDTVASSTTGSGTTGTTGSGT